MNPKTFDIEKVLKTLNGGGVNKLLQTLLNKLNNRQKCKSNPKREISFEAQKRCLSLIERLDKLDERQLERRRGFGKLKTHVRSYEDNIAILLTRDGSIHIGPKKELLKIKLPGEKLCTHLDKIHKIK